jgi:endonuclease YncB( thermonuclease family)
MMQWLALLLILGFIPAVFGLPDEAVGHVVSVISGDSLGIEMLIADARTNNVDSIKLADIEVPSTVTLEGKDAKKYAVSLLKNKTVYIDINNNTSGMRNEWGQLICVVYLMDSEFRPVWPPVNRILVDAGYAKLNDDTNNEFNPSLWWQEPPVFPSGAKRELLKAMLEKQPLPAQEPAVAVGPSSLVNTIMGNSKKSSIMQKDNTSGLVSIGYRK